MTYWTLWLLFHHPNESPPKNEVRMMPPVWSIAEFPVISECAATLSKRYRHVQRRPPDAIISPPKRPRWDNVQYVIQRCRATPLRPINKRTWVVHGYRMKDRWNRDSNHGVLTRGSGTIARLDWGCGPGDRNHRCRISGLGFRYGHAGEPDPFGVECGGRICCVFACIRMKTLIVYLKYWIWNRWLAQCK